ncbi:hypothetical protein CkaCkLH20_08418 [Colletotrichum karsti]|uniref:Uncharacterized protein n=1 Tax=Colletotrichum karsti TaxID=1095194 RepID=A0A9P6I327_9PEZI|nr:uncharacterized protein CkaCkLH20_08418 [Colletotrichum karsti]KAF9874046.1 hypothetical protein CkaCkLH20_08418 [Colletotrichum karsti]
MDSLAFYYVHRFTYLLLRKKDDIAAAALVDTDKLIDAVRMHPQTHPPCKKGSVVISIQSENGREVSIPAHPDAAMEVAYNLAQLCGEDFPEHMSAAEYCLGSVADVPIRTHVSNLVCLIRRLRTAESKEYFRRLKILRDYVCISSCENIKSRLCPQGKNQKDYYAAITRDASGTNIPWQSYHKWMYDDNTPLSAEDFEKLTQIVDLLRRSGQGEGLENFPSPETHWCHDIEGKMAFHIMLCRLLKGYADKVNSLVDVRNACRNRPHVNGTHCPGVAELSHAAAQAYQWGRALLLFRRMFGETALRKHLKVIALEFGLTDDVGDASDK